MATSSKPPKGYIGKPCIQDFQPLSNYKGLVLFFFFSVEGYSCLISYVVCRWNRLSYSLLCFVGGIVPRCLLPRRKTGLLKRRQASSELRNGLLKAKTIFYEDFFIKTINIDRAAFSVLSCYYENIIMGIE